MLQLVIGVEWTVLGLHMENVILKIDLNLIAEESNKRYALLKRRYRISSVEVFARPASNVNAQQNDCVLAIQDFVPNAFFTRQCFELG